MAYYGISSNLVVYLTKKLHQGTVKSSNNVTNWVGTIWLTPILGAYVADAHLGRYWTFVVASVIYLSVCMHAAISSFLYRTHALLLVQLPALSRPKNETIFGPHVSIQISYVNTVSYPFQNMLFCLNLSIHLSRVVLCSWSLGQTRDNYQGCDYEYVWNLAAWPNY
jgi:dipeptide/tripeptide permease